MTLSDLFSSLAPRQLLLLAGSGVFLGLTAVVMFGVKPLYERYAAASSDIDTLRGLAQLGPVGSLEPLEREIADYRRKLLGDMHDIPLKQLEAHIIGALQHNAWANDVELLTIEPQSHAGETPYQEIGFRLEIRGTYFNLDRWISSVNQQLGFVVIKEYILKIERDTHDPLLNAKVLMAAYRIGTA